MEILGSRIPGLQNAIASGLESVTAGIAESTKTSGVAALSVAQDSFSLSQIGTDGSANLPTVSQAAEYTAPEKYFQQFPGTASDSPVSALAISKTLSDPNFNAQKSLETFGKAAQGVNNIVADAINREQVNKIVADAANNANNSQGSSLGAFLSDPNLDEKGTKDSVGDLYGRPLDGKVALPHLNDVTYDAVDRFGREKADGTDSSVDYSAGDRFGRDKVEGFKPGEAQMDKPTPSAVGIRQDVINPGEAQMWKPTPSAAGMRQDVINPWEAQMWKPTPSPTSDAASNRSIIVVGGKDAASDRSIIVVGGKTPDTYLQNIDDSLNQLRQNPTGQIADLFRNQFGAVQNLFSTINQVVQLQQSFSANLFERSLRG